MPRSTKALLLMCALVLGAGCTIGADAGAVDAPAAPARIHPRWLGCATLGAFAVPDKGSTMGNTVAGAGSVPADFRATSAISCQTATRTGPDQRVVAVDLERRATAIGPLLSYLARPSQRARHPQQLVCAAMGWVPPWLFLTDDSGRWISPRLPTDPCGFPLGTFDDAHPPAYLKLHYRDLVVHQRKQPK